MRALAIAVAAVGLAVLVRPAAAAERDRPWCAELGGGDDFGAENCGFHTLEQCQAYVSGVGGYCRENPFYRGPEPEPAPARRDGRPQRRSR